MACAAVRGSHGDRTSRTTEFDAFLKFGEQKSEESKRKYDGCLILLC
jgi:hypothetical protein